MKVVLGKNLEAAVSKGFSVKAGGLARALYVALKGVCSTKFQ